MIMGKEEAERNMEQFTVTVNQLITFFILIVLGLIAARFHVLDETTLNGLSRLVIRVVLPIMMFYKLLTGSTREGLLAALVVLPISLVLYGVLALLAQICIRIFHLEGNRARVFRVLLMFGNVGFMGIPLIQVLCPDSGMVYVALFTVVDQLLFWTVGWWNSLPVTQTTGGLQLKSLKNMLSPAIFAIILSLAMVLLNLSLPDVVMTTFSAISTACMPLSLIYMGGLLYFTDIRPALRCGELYVEILVKMIVLPLLVFIVLHALYPETELATTLAILTALPAISSVAMLCRQNGSDGDYAISAVMLTTVACLITLPLVSLGISFFS